MEFEIATDRITPPLLQRGVEVHANDLLRATVKRLYAKPGGASVPVTIGDFSTSRVNGSLSLVYLVFNTIMNPTSQQEQLACFVNAAAHLRPGARFLIQVAVPDLPRLPPGEAVHPFHVSRAR